MTRVTERKFVKEGYSLPHPNMEAESAAYSARASSGVREASSRSDRSRDIFIFVYRFVQMIVEGDESRAKRQSGQYQGPGDNTPASRRVRACERGGELDYGGSRGEPDTGFPVPGHVIQVVLAAYFAPNRVHGDEGDEKLQGVKNG